LFNWIARIMGFAINRGGCPEFISSWNFVDRARFAQVFFSSQSFWAFPHCLFCNGCFRISREAHILTRSATWPFGPGVVWQGNGNRPPAMDFRALGAICFVCAGWSAQHTGLRQETFQ